MKKAYLSLLLICLIPTVGAAILANNISHNTSVPMTFGYPTMVAHV